MSKAPKKQQTPKEADRSKLHAIIILIPFAFLLMVASFLIGAMLASPAEEEVLQSEEVIDIGEEPKIEEVTEVEVLSDSLPLAMDWILFEDQSEVTPIKTLEELFRYNEHDPNFVEDIGVKAYRLGTVNGGIYHGYSLDMQVFPLGGMGTSYYHLYTLECEVCDGLPILLNNYAWISSLFGPREASTAVEIFDERIDNIAGSAILHEGIAIGEFADEDVVDVDGNEFIHTGLWGRIDEASTTEWKEKMTPVDLVTLASGEELFLTDDSVGTVGHQWFRMREDGMSVWYDVHVPFWPYEDGLSTAVPDVAWSSDGAQNDETYIKGKAGGCGFITISNVRNADDLPELKEAGTFVHDSNEIGFIYEPASYDSEYYEDMFDLWARYQDDSSFENYVASHPFFYWQDAFGRWIEFTSSEVVPPAECGKPAIYLYPEEPTSLSVYVYPEGGFTYTEPEYGEGWNVMAYPDGTIRHFATAEYYDYLWWEGRGNLYAFPDEYWVIERADVEPYLKRILFRLGLNLQETVDFLEYWLPYMDDAPYYKIGFFGTEVLDELAPLELTVDPDMVLRILMDFEPLQEEIEANPPELPPRPKREGFSVIEWGGVKR